jgi:hypothetical protein
VDRPNTSTTVPTRTTIVLLSFDMIPFLPLIFVCLYLAFFGVHRRSGRRPSRQLLPWSYSRQAESKTSAIGPWQVSPLSRLDQSPGRRPSERPSHRGHDRQNGSPLGTPTLISCVLRWRPNPLYKTVGSTAVLPAKIERPAMTRLREKRQTARRMFRDGSERPGLR